MFGRRRDGVDVAALQRELEELRRELAEARWLADEWRDEMQKTRGGFSSHIDDAVDGRVARLLGELGPALVNLCDVEAVRATLSKYGASFEGEPGTTVRFDPARHHALESLAPAPGDPVVVRVPGLVFKGRLLVLAGVLPR